MEWIKCSERMPPANSSGLWSEYVLCWNGADDTTPMFIGYFDYDDYEWGTHPTFLDPTFLGNDNLDKESFLPIYWMPLPKGPEVENS